MKHQRQPLNVIMNKVGTKKQRGSNYTPIEQTMLLELIKKNIEIIENKETNAAASSKKRTAWNEIAQRYNAMAVSGPRNWIQLRNLYENLKQRKRRQTRMERQQLHVKKINELNKIVSSDTKELSCTDDDTYNTSALNETDKWIQAMVGPKTEPMQFGIELTVSGDDMETITVPAQPPFIVKHEIEEDSISAASSSKEFPHDVSKKKPPENETTCCSSAKEEYYKIKLNNAKLERKFLLQRHKMEKEKLTLELEILNLKKQKLL